MKPGRTLSTTSSTNPHMYPWGTRAEPSAASFRHEGVAGGAMRGWPLVSTNVPASSELGNPHLSQWRPMFSCSFLSCGGD